MREILRLTDRDFDPTAPLLKIDNFPQRKTARAVVLNAEQEVGIIYAAAGDYYELPGGGVQQGESVVDALHREMLEELGCLVDVIDEIGMTEEYRHFNQTRQTSYWYLTTLREVASLPLYTADEIGAGFRVEWKDMDTAIMLVASGMEDITDHGLKFMRRRDLHVLRLLQLQQNN